MAPDISSLSGKPTRRHPPGIPSQFCKESICHPQSPLAHPPPPFVWQSGCKMEDGQAAIWLSLYVTLLQTRVIQWNDRDDRMSWAIISKITYWLHSLLIHNIFYYHFICAFQRSTAPNITPPLAITVVAPWPLAAHHGAVLSWWCRRGPTGNGMKMKPIAPHLPLIPFNNIN